MKNWRIFISAFQINYTDKPPVWGDLYSTNLEYFRRSNLIQSFIEGEVSEGGGNCTYWSKHYFYSLLFMTKKTTIYATVNHHLSVLGEPKKLQLKTFQFSIGFQTEIQQQKSKMWAGVRLSHLSFAVTAKLAFPGKVAWGALLYIHCFSGWRISTGDHLEKSKWQNRGHPGGQLPN